jgi:ADP-ribose pyrophosphatase YjhB (NUDIX family)
MIHSSGLAIIYNKKILLAHPTNSAWFNSYSIPKGHVESGETTIDAAIRETLEEVGISVPKSMIETKEFSVYRIRKGKTQPWKKISFFLVHIKSLSQLSLKDEIIPREQLQLAEVDWAGFMPIEEAKKRIHYGLIEILDHV